ncbi:xanthine dehydrogenase family protein molybdopterin-binding subunit [Acetobacteraceae bacterium H6797]|nr:xanthine dehydrogenase family protein molybdopterin-binding subunit [Acetobacteraceae bacterium H6797]
MDGILPREDGALPEGRPANLSRRGLLGAFVLGVTLPALGGVAARAQGASPAAKAPPNVQAFLEIRPDGGVTLQSPFVEGGQGIFTAMAQIVGEELDADPARFTVENAPAGKDYMVMSNGMRLTGGSMSVRMSYAAMRTIGASARQMLIQAAAARLEVPAGELTTDTGKVVHAASARSLAYGELAAEAAALPVPASVPLKDAKDFKWIGKPLARLDMHEKSVGQAVYAIDIKVEGMLQAAVQHARRLGMEPGEIRNEAAVRAMPGVHSIHRLPGAVAVVADRWWRAKRAVEALQVDWKEPAPNTPRAMPADFSSEGLKASLAGLSGPGITAENKGDVASAMKGASKVVEALYDAPFLAHAQLEPPSATARWNEDGTLDLWMPNQAPEMFQQDAAKAAGIPPERIRIHSPLLGGFFGRHFIYPQSNPYPQAIQLAKAVGRPVKLIWTREEEFLRDAFRPMGVVRFRAGLDAQGMPVALEATARGEGPMGRLFGRKPDAADSTVVEGIAEKHYAIPNRRVADLRHEYPAMIGFWRSVGHSMNDFFYETFFDEMADAGKQDPFELRRRLLAESPRHLNLINAVAELSGGWKRGPYTAADGTRRARGVAMASPFGTEVATIAEVSILDGQVKVHDVWVAIDPGSIVNPAIIEAQVNSAVAIGLSTALLEEVVYEHGMPRARNYDGYPILPLTRMPKVHVRIVESGAAMGGIGEPGVPGVPPAVVNAVAALTGQRVRSLPLSKTRFGGSV